MNFWGFLFCLYIFFLLLTFLVNQYERMNAKGRESFDPFIFVSLIWEGIVAIVVVIFNFIGLFFNYDFLFKNGSKKYPVILIAGYSANRGYFFPYAYFLNREGYRVFTYPAVPFYSNIYYLAEILRHKVEEILKETGAEKVILIGHSMGGLIARYYVQRYEGEEKVAGVVTISTPHTGTKLAVFASGYSAEEMVTGSDFLKDLNKDVGKVFKKVQLVSIGTKCDNLVVPYQNSFARVGKKHTVDFLGHNSMVFSIKVFSIILGELERISSK